MFVVCVLKALAEVRARNETVQQRDELVKLLTKERDQALSTLNRHGLMADRNIEVFTTTLILDINSFYFSLKSQFKTLV